MQGWPEVALKAFQDRYFATLSSVKVAMGQTQGKTLLPLPPGEMLNAAPAKSGDSHSAANAKGDKDRVHILESSVVMWTDRINVALGRHAESVFVNGSGAQQNPGPLVGIEFWMSKQTDLDEILKQLNGPQITKVNKVLEIIRSPYHSAFQKIIRQLEEAYTEAKDNCKYLVSIKPLFTVMLQSEYGTGSGEMADTFKPIMHVLLMIWKHSRFYNTPPSLAIIMRMMCNDVIEKSRDFLGGTAELFNAEPKEVCQHTSVPVLVHVELTACRNRYASVQPTALLETQHPFTPPAYGVHCHPVCRPSRR